MEIRSLGYRTDLIFHRFDGEIVDKSEYLVLRTPTSPDFYWGNFLLFAKPPAQGDLERWKALFAEEIGSPPETKHLVFGWDAADGEMGAIEPFEEAGFRVDRGVVLSSTQLQAPAKPADGVEVRALASDADWGLAIDNQVDCKDEAFTLEEYRDFRTQQMARYKLMSEAGLGDWYGAFVDGRVISDMGLFHDREVGRFQAVQTHPDHRRQGIASTLLYETTQLAQAKFGWETLVIVADQGSAAARLYGSLGFEMTEKQVGMEFWPGMGGA